MNILEKVQQNIENNRLIKRGERIIVAVSGGVDSAALLQVLLELRDKYKLEIIVAHVNHGLRRESEAEEKFVKTLAMKHNLKFVSKKIKLPRSNVEETARVKRYTFFQTILDKHQADSIVTAHTADDQAETILLNLIRGAGIKGLTGMKQARGVLKRPFLKITKNEILEYARKNKIQWMEDLSNQDLKYDRNKIRNKILPEMAIINPKVKENILRSAENLDEVENYISKVIGSKLKSSLIVAENKITLDLRILKTADSFIKKQVIMAAISKMIPKNLEKIHINEILEILDSPGTKQISLPLGFTATKIYDKLEIGNRKEKKPINRKKKLEKRVDWNEWEITTGVASSPVKEDQNSILIDGEAVKELFVRGKRAGDYLFLKKNKQKKKISDLFVDAKIPKKNRLDYPIIVNENDEIVLVPNLRVSGKFRADPNSKKNIKINVIKNEK